MAEGRARFPIAAVVIVVSNVSSSADAFAFDRGAKGNAVDASIAAVFREAVEDTPRFDLIEPAASPWPLPVDPDFGIERFPAFDDTIDAPPVPREPKVRWIRILTDLTFRGSADWAVRSDVSLRRPHSSKDISQGPERYGSL